MTVTFDSMRFGTLEVTTDSLVEFPSGLIGLGGSQYVLLAREEESAFVWLHSVEDPSLALPVCNPFRFFEDYEIVLSDAEAERIGISDPTQCDVYVTVRAAESLEDFTANLRAPILISHGRGHQVITETEAPVRASLFPELSGGPEPVAETQAA
jgi:flagellar assembly factor FliW